MSQVILLCDVLITQPPLPPFRARLTRLDRLVLRRIRARLTAGHLVVVAAAVSGTRVLLRLSARLLFAPVAEAAGTARAGPIGLHCPIQGILCQGPALHTMVILLSAVPAYQS